MTQMSNGMLEFICKIHNKNSEKEVPQGAGHLRPARYPDKFFCD